MKKFFTLIAAVALAASVNAQTTYSFENLSQDNFEYSADEYKWDTTGEKFDLLKASKTEYCALSLKDTPVSFKYKNSKVKENVFDIPTETVFRIQAKGSLLEITGLTAGQELTIKVASKGSTASSFSLQEGGEIVGSMPTFAAYDKNYDFKEIKVKATAEKVVLKESNGGYVISSIVVSSNGTTGISSVNAAAAKKDGKTYNMAGQEVSSSAKGLIIKNGKKYVK